MVRSYRIAVKVICGFLAVLLLLPVMPSRAAVTTEGVCGDNLYWHYDKNVLTISGTGDMYDFVQKSSQNRPNEAPWRMLDTSISRVRIEEGVTGIGEYAFYNFAPVAEIEFPESSLKRIGKYAFSGCQYLQKVVLPDSLESVGTAAFSNCRALASVDFGLSDVAVAPNMFAGDKVLSSVTLSPSTREILTYAFSDCSALTEIDLTNIERIESLSFQNCPLTSVSFGANVNCLQSNAFYGCSQLADVTFTPGARPRQVSNLFLNSTPYYTALPDGLYTMFEGTVLMNKGTYTGSSLTVPEGIAVIADVAFDKSSNLKSVEFPSTLRTIGSYAFRDCKKLLSVYVPQTVEYLLTNCLGKYTVDIVYDNLAGFTISSVGLSPAAEYAGNEGFAYICLHEFIFTETVADCTAGGFRREVCAHCGVCIGREPIAPAEHRFELTEVAPTCEEDGYTLSRCTVCGATETAPGEAATGHEISDEWTVVSLPDCRSRGLAARLCLKCGEPMISLPIETSHVPAEEATVVKAPRCTSDGLSVTLCSVCGTALSREILPAAGHVPADELIRITLPSEDGIAAGCSVRVCAVCKEILETLWLDSKGVAVEGGAEAADRSVRTSLRGDADLGSIGSYDFNSDGIFSIKDLASLKKLLNGETVR